ncbi:MAG: paiB [Gammaproteobacteria bacterium]|nr:paiB [Gammaproteobacteria bacterium]
MYTPKHFKEENVQVLRQFIQDNSFATLITHDAENNLCVSHINLMLDEEQTDRVVLYGHVARANPQALQMAKDPKVLAIFTGPHTYISPTWYTKKDVPTWNYVAVHAHGNIQIITDKEKLKGILDKLVAKYESDNSLPWTVPWQEDRYEMQLNAIVGFTIEVTHLEGNFKLSQNRSQEDKLGVIKHLEASGSDADQSVAQLMRQRCPYANP